MSTSIKRPSLLSHSDSDTEEDVPMSMSIQTKNNKNNINSLSDEEAENNADDNKEKDNFDNALLPMNSIHPLKKKQRFNEDMLCNTQLGLQRIYKEFPQSCGSSYKGRGGEDVYLKNLISNYKEWAFQLYDIYHYNDVLDAVDRLGSKAYVRNYLETLRDKERLRYVSQVLNISTDNLPQSFPGITQSQPDSDSDAHRNFHSNVDTDVNHSGYTTTTGTGTGSTHAGTDNYKRKRTPLSSDSLDSNASMMHNFASHTVLSPHTYGNPTDTPMASVALVKEVDEVDDDALLSMMAAYESNQSQISSQEVAEEVDVEVERVADDSMGLKEPCDHTVSEGEGDAAETTQETQGEAVNVDLELENEAEFGVGSGSLAGLETRSVLFAATQVDETQTQEQLETQIYNS